MAKKILFPQTNRVHSARQGLLLEELGKHFNVHISEFDPGQGSMADKTAHVFEFFRQELESEKPDLLLARGDRFEVLPIVILAAYMGIPIAHLEGGDVSLVIDGKVRHAISHLSDYHFPTNQDAYERLIKMGIPKSTIWNYGSLDVDFALKVKPKNLRERPYILVCYHPIDDESEDELTHALKSFEGMYETVFIISNSDYGRTYGQENYSPEEYINLVRFAKCCVGNSSSFFKEASVFGTPVINVGRRQRGRLRTKNIIDVPCELNAIQKGITLGLVSPRKTDSTYYQQGTSKKITSQIKEILA